MEETLLPLSVRPLVSGHHLPFPPFFQLLTEQLIVLGLLSHRSPNGDENFYGVCSHTDQYGNLSFYSVQCTK